MTVGITILCKDGIVLAADSLATFSRGAPVARYTNKVYELKHGDLLHPVAIVGAGMTAFIDKFVDRAKRDGIAAASKSINRKLDIVDFVERVGETTVSFLFKEYALDRNKFFEVPVSHFSLSLLIAGATRDGELRAYHIHSEGLSESISGYGTTGSGAPYAELFLHGFFPEPEKTSVKEAVRLGCYAIKGAEIMDINVGGNAKVCTLMWDKDNKHLVTEILKSEDIPKGAKAKMEKVLQAIGQDFQEIIIKKGGANDTNDNSKKDEKS